MIRKTKYLEESLTDSTEIPGYASIGHLANSSPVFLSSSLIASSFPLEINRILPVHDGSAKFQSAALLKTYIIGTIVILHGKR